MNWGEIILSLFLDLILTVFFYLFVPVVFCIRKKPMTQKQIKKVIIINGVCVCLLCGIIAGRVTAAVFLWSWVGKKIMERVLLVDDERDGLREDPNRLYECKSCGYRNHDYFDTCPECGNNTKRYAYINQESTLNNQDKRVEDIPPVVEKTENSNINTSNFVNSQITIDTPPVVKNEISFCRKCGTKLLEDSLFCSKCGTKIHIYRNND